MSTAGEGPEEFRRPDPGRLDVTSVLDALTDPCCRYVLYRLQDAERPLPVEDLAAGFAALDADGRGRSTAEVERVASRLSHACLEMAEFGLLAYDPATPAVALAEEVTFSVDPPAGRGAGD